MLYNIDEKSDYKINTDDLNDYVLSFAPKKKPDPFFEKWAETLIRTYNENQYQEPDHKTSYNKQIIKITEDCSFYLNYDIAKIKKYSQLNNLKTVSAAEFKKMGIIINKSASSKPIPIDRPLENPIVVISECPFKTTFKKVAMIGIRNIIQRVNRNMRIDYIFLPRKTTALTLSQPFEKAWYTFIEEYNRYIELEYPIERKRFFDHSDLHRIF
jgi:hypothetical protein